MRIDDLFRSLSAIRDDCTTFRISPARLRYNAQDCAALCAMLMKRTVVELSYALVGRTGGRHIPRHPGRPSLEAYSLRQQLSATPRVMALGVFFVATNVVSLILVKIIGECGFPATVGSILCLASEGTTIFSGL
jgi:hypothetical protein